MNTTEIFLIAMLLIFVAPYLLWRLGRTDYFAPLVVVQIIMGILLGPGVLGAAFPQYHAFVFNSDVVKTLNGIAWWGVMLFVMLAGIELDLKKVWQYRRESMTTAGLSLSMPLLFGCGAALLLVGYQGWMGAYGRKLANGARPLENRTLRIMNEIPGIATALIVVALHSKYEWIFVTTGLEYFYALAVGMIAGIAQQMGYWAPRRRGPAKRPDATASEDSDGHADAGIPATA